jgi:hypothetical protein
MIENGSNAPKATGRKPQIAALRSPTGRLGPRKSSEACLMRRTVTYLAFNSRDLGNPGWH